MVLYFYQHPYFTCKTSSRAAAVLYIGFNAIGSADRGKRGAPTVSFGVFEPGQNNSEVVLVLKMKSNP